MSLILWYEQMPPGGLGLPQAANGEPGADSLQPQWWRWGSWIDGPLTDSFIQWANIAEPTPCQVSSRPCRHSANKPVSSWKCPCLWGRDTQPKVGLLFLRCMIWAHFQKALGVWVSWGGGSEKEVGRGDGGWTVAAGASWGRWCWGELLWRPTTAPGLAARQLRCLGISLSEWPVTCVKEAPRLCVTPHRYCALDLASMVFKGPGGFSAQF